MRRCPRDWHGLYGTGNAKRDSLEEFSGWVDDDDDIWWVTVDPRTGIAWTWCAS